MKTHEPSRFFLMLRAIERCLVSVTLFAGLLTSGTVQAAATGVQASAVAITVDQFLDWAERTYPAFFPGQQSTQTLPPYAYRYYPGTAIYLAVGDGVVLALGPPTNNQPLALGKLGDFACLVSPASCTSAIPQTGHPRLWLTAADLPRLRSWANDANPVYRDGLKVVAERAKADMDRGALAADCGGREWEEFPTEMYAELFAFMSLIETDASVRSDYATRARTLLMAAINQAAQGPATERNHTCGYPPFRDPDFFTTDSNRARWHGEGFALTADWIYPSLSTQDKQSIRSVFLRWSQDIVERGYHHPEPLNTVNDPALLTQAQVRWSGNNYFTAHMRNMGMMALALDPADDAGNALRNYLGTATGAWLYTFDRLTRTDSLGGMLPEGTEYSPQTASYAAQFLLALRTAGVDTCGTHCQMGANVFWDDFLAAYFHALSPAPVASADAAGTAYLPALYGDAQNYRSPDYIDSFAAVGIFDMLGNNPTRLNALRWAQLNTAPGGAQGWLRRVSNSEDFRQSLLYFMLFDPAAVAAQDPRSGFPLTHFAPGLNKILTRTGWDANASWLNYSLGWRFIDHQTADGNNFEWYRKGEWLTKGRSGYPDIAEGIASSEFYNTIAIENSKPNREASDWRTDLWERGSQWNYVTAGNPTVVARSDTSRYTYVTGDATNLYNSTSEGATDVLHASRSLVWLKQEDVVVVYDRAQSKTANRFKRWWLQLENLPVVTGNRALAITPSGQQLSVISLLPSNALLTAVGTPPAAVEDKVARGEPMKVRLRIDAPNAALDERFLNVLQAVDSGVAQKPVSLVQPISPGWSGAQIGSTVVVFVADVTQVFAGLSYTTPSTATAHHITGLQPTTGYTVIRTGNTVTVQSGGSLLSDAGGVLELR